MECIETLYYIKTCIEINQINTVGVADGFFLRGYYIMYAYFYGCLNFSLITLKIVLYNNSEDQYENHSPVVFVCVRFVVH